MARAEASNPAGWRMLADASARLSLPHLPGGLATRLAAAEKDLVRRARLLAEAADGFAGRPDDFGSALAETQDQAGRFPGWPVTLIGDLGRAGHGAEAVRLSQALAVVDPARYGFFAGEAAVALAEGGLAEGGPAEGGPAEGGPAQGGPQGGPARRACEVGWPTTRGRRSPRTSNAGPMTSGPGYSPVTRWPSSAIPKRRSPISRRRCRWHGRPRTTR